MGRKKTTQALNSENAVVLSKIPQSERDIAKLRFLIRDIIDAVNNPQDEGVETFTTNDLAIVGDAMTKAIYDTNSSGIVDASSSSIIVAKKGASGTINPGEAVYITGNLKIERVDNTFLTGVAAGIALEPITHLTAGRVMVLGKIEGIDTSTFSLGPIWVGPVPGIGTQVPPVAGQKNQILGLVTNVDPINGAIIIAPSDIKNTDADFSIYNPGANIFITATDVQAALNQIEALFVQNAIYHYVEDEASTIEAASIWTNKVSLNIANLPAGDYEWQWSAEVNCTAANRQVQVRVLENAVIVNEQDIEPKDTANWYPVTAFKKYVHPAPGPFILDMEFRRSANPAGAACRRARISIKSL